MCFINSKFLYIVKKLEIAKYKYIPNIGLENIVFILFDTFSNTIS